MLLPIHPGEWTALTVRTYQNCGLNSAIIPNDLIPEIGG